MKRVALVIYDDVDLLDVGGPYEVFLTANRLAVRREEPAPFETRTVALAGRPVTAYGGMGLVPHGSIADAGPVDIAVVPGAVAIEEVLARSDLQAAIRTLLGSAELVTSVCVGAFFLADAGLLDGRVWTTHWEDIAALAARLGADTGRRARWVDSGRVVTAGGLSSGIAMALHLVDRLVGRDLAVATAKQIDYVWDPEDGVVAPAEPAR